MASRPVPICIRPIPLSTGRGLALVAAPQVVWCLHPYCSTVWTSLPAAFSFVIPHNLDHTSTNTSATNRFRRWIHHPPTPAAIITQLQEDAQVWARLLFMSGGLLKLRKCLYYVMSWDYDSEGRDTLCSKENTPSLLLTNGTDLAPKAINQHD
jgi:hypothetical protein